MRLQLLNRWEEACAVAKRRGVAWPVADTLNASLTDLENSLLTAQMPFIGSGRRPASWLRNGSGIDLSLRCKRWRSPGVFIHVIPSIHAF